MKKEAEEEKEAKREGKEEARKEGSSMRWGFWRCQEKNKYHAKAEGA